MKAFGPELEAALAGLTDKTMSKNNITSIQSMQEGELPPLFLVKIKDKKDHLTFNDEAGLVNFIKGLKI